MHIKLSIFVALLLFMCDQRQLLASSTRLHLGLCLCGLHVCTELVPPLLFITRFLPVLLQSSLSLQTLFWLFSEGVSTHCQETIRPPWDIFLKAVLCRHYPQCNLALLLGTSLTVRHVVYDLAQEVEVLYPCM